jgi:hypothetical protein
MEVSTQIAHGLAHTFSFVGNCQLQYYAHHLARVLSAATFCLGRIQIPFDGRTRAVEDLDGLAAQARSARSDGKTATLVVQESLIGKGSVDLTDSQRDAFDVVIRVPIVHFRTIWPDFHVSRPFTPTTRAVRRMFDREQEKIDETLDRCGDHSFDADAFWDHALDRPAFYHPGHADQGVHAMLYDGFLRTPLTRVVGDAAVDRVAEGVASSRGLPLTSLHPIRLEWGDVVGATWHRHAAYERWSAHAEAVGDERESASVVEDVGAAFGPTMKALCADSLSRQHVAAGKLKAGAALAATAAVELPLTWQVMGNALATNNAAGDTEAVKTCLRAVRSSIEPGSVLALNVADWLDRYPRFADELPELKVARPAGRA